MVVAGRPNVGKSSLVNRIVGRRVAVVEEEPGVTRDRNVLAAEWSGVSFDIVDTGGWLRGGAVLDGQVRRQVERALAEADLVLFVVDASVPVTEEDHAAAKAVRRGGAPVLLVANKVDGPSREAGIWSYVSLGIGDPWPVSALHGRGTGDLLDVVAAAVGRLDQPIAASKADKEHPTVAAAAEAVKVALVGRPNAGKSTLFNRLIGEERSIVHDLPGTTRDVVDTEIDTEVGRLRFLDTAGMRRPSRIGRGTEHYAVLRALEALERADVAVLVVDATVGPSHQDQRLAERAAAAGCAAVVVLNKWDALDAARREEVVGEVGDRLIFVADAPVLRVSARSGRGIGRLVPAIASVLEGYHQRVTTGMLNRVLKDLQAAHPAPGARVRYGVQGATDPPTFTLFANARLPASYLRYLESGLRRRFSLGSTPIKVRVRVEGRRR